jgi:succinate dehydrogenase hydrophobic anchor subunit
MNLLMKSYKKMSLLMMSSSIEMFMIMLKILHKDSWIEILHKPMILISMMTILWNVLCHMIKRKNL